MADAADSANDKPAAPGKTRPEARTTRILARAGLPLRHFSGLSGRLLILTVLFVMAAEVFIFVPSLSRFRLVYLQNVLADAHLAVLAIGEMSPSQSIDGMVVNKLLDVTGAQIIAVRHVEPEGAIGSRQIIAREAPKAVDVSFDLTKPSTVGLIFDAFETLLTYGNRTIRLIGPSPKDPLVEIEVVQADGPLRKAMMDYAGRIALLSLIIATSTAGLLYFALQWMMVRPIRRMTASMIAFRNRPEDIYAAIEPLDRADEIGLATRELARMEAELRAALVQRTRLASIGAAVAKFTHDLRNTLAVAMLAADALASHRDPKVSKRAESMLATIDRCVSLCAQSLKFARDGAPEINPGKVDLDRLVADVADSLEPVLASCGARLEFLGAPGASSLVADPDQLFRMFGNLVRNAVEAGAKRVAVTAGETKGGVWVDVADDGPGLPVKAIENLFMPFQASARSGGTGLGLAIARDLARAHGGDIELRTSDPSGAVFRISLPH